MKKGTQTTQSSNSILEEIENKINTKLETISSDEDLVEIDDEEIQFNWITLFWILKSVWFDFIKSKLPESYILKIKVSKKGGVIKIWSVKIYAHLIKVKFVFITLIKWYLNFV